MNNPKVYVGTYAKYNRGSIAGGWVSHLECKDYRAFLSKCRALHRGERDPEFMIQDNEDFPDGLDCMEWLGEQDFNDVIAACKEQDAEEKASAPSLTEQLRAALLARLGSHSPVQESDKELLEAYLAEWAKVDSDLDYHRKQFSGAVRLQNGGICYFERPTMKNRFCFRDEGPDYDFYCKLLEDKEKNLRDYFLQENLSDYDEKIRALECNCRFGDEYHPRYYCKDWYIQQVSYCDKPTNLWEFYAWRKSDLEGGSHFYGKYEKMTDADRMAILAGMKRERDKFDKRLQAYLKRYGTSKIHTWTYWADA